MHDAIEKSVCMSWRKPATEVASGSDVFWTMFQAGSGALYQHRLNIHLVNLPISRSPLFRRSVPRKSSLHSLCGLLDRVHSFSPLLQKPVFIIDSTVFFSVFCPCILFAMHALAFFLLAPILSDLTVAQPYAKPQHRRHDKRMLEEVINVEVEAWTTVTLDGPEPSGWYHSDHPDKAEKTVASWVTSIPDSTSATNIPALGSNAGEKDYKDFTGFVIAAPSTSDAVAPSSSAETPSVSSSSTTIPKMPISPASGGEKKAAVEPPVSSSTAADSAPPAHSETSPSANEASSAGPTSVASSAAASSSSSTPQPAGKNPFSALVAFGDNLSDNGNGSYAHHVADKNNPYSAIYGARTWTNAQVAVSFLTDLLGVPMNQDFAFGHAWGGSDAGATLDNTMYVSDFHNATVAAELGCPGAPPASQQVSTYISQGVNKEALHFLWIGNNDADMVGFYQPSAFTKNLTTGMTKVVGELLDAGAPYVFIPNIYPKQLAPVVPKYYGWTSQSDQDAFGTFITNANNAMKSALASMPNSDKVIYYDANAFLTSVWNNAANYGITNAKDTNGWPAFCDGDPDQTSDVKAAIAAGTINQQDHNNWGICVDDHEQDKWFWMQYLDMTSHVHELLAGDMNKAIAAHFA